MGVYCNLKALKGIFLCLIVISGWSVLSGISSAKAGVMEEAFSELGKAASDFVLPRWEESYYRPVGFFPVIDLIGFDPFSLPDYAEQASLMIKEAGVPSEVFEALLRAVLAEVPVTSEVHVFKTIRQGPEGRTHIEGGDWDSALIEDEETGVALEEFGRVFNVANRLRERALAGLTEQDRHFLTSDIGLYFYENGMLRFLTSAVGKQHSIMEIVRKTDVPALFQAQLLLLKAAERYLDRLEEFSSTIDPVDDQILLEADFPWGRMIVGGTGANIYEEDAALLIDLGGNDVYRNNAGGTGAGKTGTALLIDLSGDDVYRSKEAGAQGFGFLGTGALIDLSGDDNYSAMDFSQGGGYLGAGMLWDADGNDDYHGRNFVQGVGLFGGGILCDLNGDDRYLANQLAQGFGSTLGTGLLNDRAGDDRYSAEESGYGFAQGSGCGCRSYPWLRDYSFYGGVGFLIDQQGDDSYKAASFVQGGSYFLSLGILVDEKGNDYYAGKGSYSHGGGVHLTNGYMLDREGDDIYFGAWAGTAVGNDRSAGFFMDMKGADRYYAGSCCGQGYSHKPHGLSLFIEAAGDDIYRAEEHSQAYVLPPIIPGNWGHVIFTDYSGKDFYSIEGRGDNRSWLENGHAVGIDTESEWNDDFFDDHTFSAFQNGSFFRYADRKKEEIFDPYHLCAAVGKTVATAKTSDGAELFARLKKASGAESVIVREAITEFMLQKETEPPAPATLCEGLESDSPEIRAFTAMIIDIYETEFCGHSLIENLDDPEPYVRKLIYRAAGSVAPDRGLPQLEKAYVSEENADCRAALVSAIGAYKDQPAFDTIALAATDPDEHVRMAAASALAAFEKNEAVALLRGLSHDESPYVKKTAGESLLKLGQREGALPMIEYLRFYALDTSSDNYGSNIGAVLTEYANVDFGRNYDQWITWYKKNGRSFDLKKNLQAREQYRKALKHRRNGNQKDMMIAFEEALEENPDYLKAKIDYASVLNNKAWNLVTSPENDHDLTRGLELARRCVELDPQPNYLDTLAEACYQNGLFQEAFEYQKKALDKDENNSEFLKRLNKIRKSLQES